MMSGSEIDWLGTASVPVLIAGLLAFSALVVFALVHAPNNAPEQAGIHLRTPRETLDEHLTKGELTRDEYVERRKVLDFNAAIV